MRRPWNLVSYAVYSLVTLSHEWVKNMNIMTYVIPVSMNPKHYILAIYAGTQTLENWSYTHRGILQILAPSHAPLVHILGKKTGKSYDKMSYLSRKWFLSPDGLIDGIAWYLELEEIERLGDGGWDHTLFLCRVVSSRTYHESVLMTGELVEKGVIL